MTQFSCGCINERDPGCGAMRCVSKCAFHVKWKADQPVGEGYYKMLGSITESGEMADARYVPEWEEAMGPLPTATLGATALEIGCGASPYAGYLLGKGYKYIGIDTDPWACAWTTSKWGVATHCIPFPVPPRSHLATGSRAPLARGIFDLILCAHALEHMDDAHLSLEAMRRHLRPGGFLAILVPDDQDMTNPDHMWFFKAPSLRAAVTNAGFEYVQIVEKRVVEREMYLYCTARKPCDD